MYFTVTSCTHTQSDL